MLKIKIGFLWIMIILAILIIGLNLVGGRGESKEGYKNAATEYADIQLSEGAAPTLPPQQAAQPIDTTYNSDPNVAVTYHPEEVERVDATGETNLNPLLSEQEQGAVMQYQAKPAIDMNGEISINSYTNKGVSLNQSTYSTDATLYGGFCAAYSAHPEILDTKCGELTGDTCAATSCCVLLGGTKCIRGGETGPADKMNYQTLYAGEMNINTDFYYYQGKCYGNCPP